MKVLAKLTPSQRQQLERLYDSSSGLRTSNRNTAHSIANSTAVALHKQGLVSFSTRRSPLWTEWTTLTEKGRALVQRWRAER